MTETFVFYVDETMTKVIVYMTGSTIGFTLTSPSGEKTHIIVKILKSSAKRKALPAFYFLQERLSPTQTPLGH